MLYINPYWRWLLFMRQSSVSEVSPCPWELFTECLALVFCLSHRTSYLANIMDIFYCFRDSYMANVLESDFKMKRFLWLRLTHHEFCVRLLLPCPSWSQKNIPHVSSISDMVASLFNMVWPFVIKGTHAYDSGQELKHILLTHSICDQIAAPFPANRPPLH